MATSVQLVLMRGDRADQPDPDAVVAGTLYCVEDEGNIVEQSDGAAWEPWGSAAGGAGVLTVLAADPSSPVDGTAWLKFTGGELTLNLRDSSSTTSIPLATIP